VLLLVEDVPEIGLIAQRLGRRAGHTVEWCARAEEAWEYLQRTRPDLVLLDVHLPGMSGLELCQRVRAAPHLAGLPVALFTNRDRPEDVRAVEEAGADFVLSKDVLCQPDVWQGRVGEMLKAAR
jgi:CheY-like chemotaxis protein